MKILSHNVVNQQRNPNCILPHEYEAQRRSVMSLEAMNKTTKAVRTPGKPT